MKKDKIFYSAASITALGAILALSSSFYCFPLFILAALLRPLLSNFPRFKNNTDERELSIQTQAGDLAFITLILALTGAVIMRSLQGHHADELYMLIAIGVVIRKLITLFLRGEYYNAAATVIKAIGFFLGLFIILSAGFNSVAILGILVMVLFWGIAVLIHKHPATAIIAMTLITGSIFFLFKLYLMAHNTLQIWLFIVFPLLFALACVLIGLAEEKYNFIPKQILTLPGLIVFILFEVFVYVYSLQAQAPIDVVFKELPREKSTYVQGLPLKGTVTYFQNGKVQSGLLDSSFTFGTATLPRNTKVYFTENGQINFAFLPYDYRITGYECKGEGPENWQTVLYADGRLKIFWPAHDTQVKGIPCRASDFWNDLFSGESSVHLYHNGSLKRAKLAADCRIGGIFLKRNTHIELDSNGTLLKHF